MKFLTWENPEGAPLMVWLLPGEITLQHSWIVEQFRLLFHTGFMPRLTLNVFYNIVTLKKLKLMQTFLKNAAALGFISVVVYIIFAAFDIYTFSRVDECTGADAAIVLGAGVWNNQPSPVFRERINHGIWLYKNGFAKHLIFTGGIGEKSNVSEAFAAKDYAIQNNVPAGKIFIEELSTITLENIVYAKEIIDDNNFNKIIIVSDPLHMKRSITMAKDYGLDVYSSPTPTTRYVSWKTKTRFLFYELFFYCAYIVYKYLSAIVLCTIVFGILLLIWCYRIFRNNCA